SIANVCAAARRLRRPCDRQRERGADRTPCRFATRIVVATGSRHWTGRRFGTTESAASRRGKGQRHGYWDLYRRRLHASNVRLDRPPVELSGASQATCQQPEGCGVAARGFRANAPFAPAPALATILWGSTNACFGRISCDRRVRPTRPMGQIVVVGGTHRPSRWLPGRKSVIRGRAT